MRRLPPTIERIAAAVALTTAFVVMASVFAPDLSHAETDRVTPTAPAAAPDAAPDAAPRASYRDVAPAPRSLGSIEDDRYIVHIFSSPAGPRYSVSSRESGAELGVMMTAEEVAEWFPDLPLPTMDFGAGSALMMVDPASDHHYP